MLEIYSEKETLSFFFSEIILINKIFKQIKNKTIIVTYNPNKIPELDFETYSGE